jgi:hypothetical protein
LQAPNKFGVSAVKEEDDVPDIICDDPLEAIGADPSNAESVPQFYVESATINAAWVFHFDDSEIPFDQVVSDQIEKDYVMGKFAAEGIYSEQPFQLTFAESLLNMGENTYMVERKVK